MSDEDAGSDAQAVLRSAAKRIVAHRLEVPAKLFLDMHKPLCGVLHNMMLVSEPMLAVFLGARYRDTLNHLFQSPENVESFLQMIEEAEKERGTGGGHSDSAKATSGQALSSEKTSGSI